MKPPAGILNRGTVVPLLALLLASAIGVSLVVLRVVWTRRLEHLYLPWNLMLAWLPMVFAWIAWRLDQQGRARSWRFAASASAWLLFFPNAPYLVTDFVHVVYLHPGAPAPLWFDLLLHLLFAVTGLLLGFWSLAMMQQLVGCRWGQWSGRLFAATALALAGFGVYLGRFLRWNSWDVVRSPFSLLADIVDQLLNPMSHPRAYGFSVFCFVFLLLSYAMCSNFGRFLAEQEVKGGK